MNFKIMKDAMMVNLNMMVKGQDTLFETFTDKDEMWDVYLNSFPKGTNNIFREREEHNCSCCKSFIRNFGNVVVIENGQLRSIWDFKSEEYQPILDAMSKLVKSMPISNVHVATNVKIGTDFNYETINGESVRWEHFFVKLDKRFVNTSSDSIGDIQGRARSTKDVFKRALREITTDAINTVLELVAENLLYRGTEFGKQVEKLGRMKEEFVKLSEKEQDMFAWENSVKLGGEVTNIRNSIVGTLLVDLSEGVDIETAVSKYDAKFENYKRPTKLATKQMKEKAKQTIIDLGYETALGRRHANIRDITVNNILFANRNVVKTNGSALDDIFDAIGEKKTSVNMKSFNGATEISIEDFLASVLPNATGLEVLLENRHENNLMSLVAPQDATSKNMFKWDNRFGWAYNGNITDSSMKKRVKDAGGKVDGDLRFSIQWNDDERNEDDLDAHCKEADGNLIYFGSDRSRRTGGELDVDIQHPRNGQAAVENITWADRNRMIDGDYKMMVNNYSNRGGKGGFKAEIEFDGEVHSFHYPHSIRDSQTLDVAIVTLKNGVFTIRPLIEGSNTMSSKEIWNLETNNFQPVSVMMFSPNYWDEQYGNGNRHYFFMLKDCQNEQSPNGFFNEYLKGELYEHKVAFESLGGVMRVQHTDDQLSGVGFSSTKRADVIVRVEEGQTVKLLRIKF